MEVPEKLKDAIVCAVMSEAANRFISFLVGKWKSRMSSSSPTEEEDQEDEKLEDSLRRLLLRVRAVVEEAEGRHITDHAMLQQLSLLREEMYVGYYRLDNTRCRAAVVPAADGGDDEKRRQYSFALSQFSSAKRLRVRSAGSGKIITTSEDDDQLLQPVVGRLQAVLETSVHEFLTLSGRYPPRLSRQPYSAYLLVDKFMFGRQVEMEHVVSFLLREDYTPSTPGGGGGGSQHLGILPVVGPGKVGKSTLVEHASMDQRVRDRFSRIVSLTGAAGTGDDLKNKIEDAVSATTTLRSSSNDGPPSLAESSRVLIIVELNGDIDEGSWRRLSTAARSHAPCGSKMIVTSRSDNVARLGTVLPLRLGFFAPEAYWYFFKVRTFGTMDVSEHPKLAAIAMDIARESKGCFMAANIFRGVLQSNMSARCWSLALATLRGFTKRNVRVYSDAHRFDPWRRKAGPIHVPIRPDRYGFVILHSYQTRNNGSEAPDPMVTVQDVISGNARPRGKFSLLAWKSHIPPHYSYVFDCEERSPRRVVSRKKERINQKI